MDNHKSSEQVSIKTSSDLLHINPNKPNKLLISSPDKNTNIQKKKPVTFRVGNLSILDQVRNFLPQIDSANKTINSLPQDKKEDLNIENINSKNEQFIEMNLQMIDNDLLASSSEDENESETDSENENVNNNKQENIKDNIEPKSMLIEELNTEEADKDDQDWNVNNIKNTKKTCCLRKQYKLMEQLVSRFFKQD